MKKIKQSSIGKRKTSIANIKLTDGKGIITVNGRSFQDYFHSFQEEAQSIKRPLILTNYSSLTDIEIKVSGGGLSSQLDAIRLAIAKFLCKEQPSVRSILKQSLLLRRDSRVKERKKYGLKKARKASQYSKR